MYVGADAGFRRRHSWPSPFLQRLLHLANAMVDQPIGVAETENGIGAIHFNRVLLATFDERDISSGNGEVLSTLPDYSVTNPPGCSGSRTPYVCAPGLLRAMDVDILRRDDVRWPLRPGARYQGHAQDSLAG